MISTQQSITMLRRILNCRAALTTIATSTMTWGREQIKWFMSKKDTVSSLVIYL